MSGSAGETQRLLGELVATVKAFDARLADRQREASAAETRMVSEITTLKHEARTSQQVFTGQMDLFKASQGKTDNEVADIKRTIAHLQEEIEAISGPVAELVSFRKRLGAFSVLFLSVIATIWAIVGPLVSAGAQKFVGLLVGK